MRRAELVDLIGRATEASGQNQVYVIGSQAILASYDESRLPANIWMSPEADMFPIADDEHETVSMKMEIYGEASNYAFRTGYFIDPVSRTTAKLPEGWEKRVVKIRTPAPVGSPRKGRRTGLCLEAHDICASKLARGEEKDVRYVETLITSGLVDAGVVVERVRAIPDEKFESREQHDAAVTRAQTLARSDREDVAEARGRIFIGTSAWQKRAWNGSFYPSGLAQAKQLAYYAERISTVEVNSTYHRLQSPSTFLKWHGAVPEHFVFAVKAHGAITHERGLRGAEREIAAFLASGPLLLREKLGPFLWQLPPSLAFDPTLIDGFLSGLPRSVDEARNYIVRHGGQFGADLASVPDRPLRHAMEVRHASFIGERYLDLLRRQGVAAVVTSSPERPVIDAVTADFVYVRFEDTLRRFPGGQTRTDLERHAARIRAWLNGFASDAAGLDVFFYFDDPDYKKTPTDRPPFDAIALQQLAGGVPPTAGVTQQTGLW